MSTKRWTILEVLDWTRGHFEAKGISSARLDAEIIIAHALNLQRVMLYARFDQPLKPDELTAIREMVARRAKHEPMAHLLGKREFWSLDLEVTADTLIPRPDTETLVELALEKMAADASFVDVGTGSGCIALALASERKEAPAYATDVSEAALTVARRNAESLELNVDFLQGSLLSPLPDTLRGELGAVIANLPYIPTADCEELMVEVRDFEPRGALDGGPDGLDLIRQLISQAKEFLRPEGLIALEAGPDQVPGLADALTEAGYRDAAWVADPTERPRVAWARMP